MAQLSLREAIKIRSFRFLWLAQLVSIFGDFLAIFGVLSVVTFNLHGTASRVTMLLVAYQLPLAVISPLAGVLVDRWNAKWTMVLSDVLRGILVLALLFTRDLHHIYAIFFGLSTVSSFFVPAQSVAIRRIVPTTGLIAANTLMSQAVQGMQIISPALAGVLVQSFGPSSCYLFDSFSFFFSASMVMSIAFQYKSTTASQPAGHIVSSLVEGLKFIFGHITVSFVVISITAGMFAVRCFGALISIYVRDDLAGSAALFGTLNSLIGIGMIVGGQFLPRLARKQMPKYLVVYGLAGVGAAIFVTAFFGSIAFTGVSMLGLGFSAALIFIPAQALIQQETPPALLGRVSSELASLLSFSQVIAIFVAGPIAQGAGIRNLYYGSAALLMLIAIVGLLRLGRQVDHRQDNTQALPASVSIPGTQRDP
jgi:MFS family permease